MDNLSENRGRSGGRRAVIALASCAFGAGIDPIGITNGLQVSG